MTKNLSVRLKSLLRRLNPSQPIRRMMAYGILSAALQTLSGPPYAAWGLCFVGLVPLFVGLFEAQTLTEAFWLGFSETVSIAWFAFYWVAFVATNFGGLPWIVGKLVMLGFSLFGELQFTFFTIVAFWALKRFKNASPWAWHFYVLLGLPVLYTGFDFAYPKLFPNTPGHFLLGWMNVVQTVELVGAYGLTLVVLLSNVAIAVLVSSFMNKRRPAYSAFVMLALVALCLWQADRWGARRIAALENMEAGFSRKLKVSVIQANIGDLDKLASESGYGPAVQKVLGTYRAMSLETVRRVHPDLLIWPETAYPFLYTHMGNLTANMTGSARDEWVRSFMAELKTPLYFGGYSAMGRRDFNSAFLLEPPFELKGVYRKSILLAFGEYVPLGPLSGIVQDLIPSIADFGRGPGATVINFKGINLAPQICYEGIYPDHSREGVRLGADLLLNITNDSWFGPGSEPWWHLWLTTFRSIELRRPMVRGTNTGVSAFVSMTGETRWRTQLFEPTTLDVTVSLPGPGEHAPDTFYARHGDWVGRWAAAFAMLCTVLLAGPKAWGLAHSGVTRAHRRLRRG